jgi:hypothetical protein
MQPMQRRTSLAHMSPSEKMERREEQARDRKRAALTTPESKSDLQKMQPMQRRTSLAHMSASEKIERRKEQARDRKRRVRGKGNN